MSVGYFVSARRKFMKTQSTNVGKATMLASGQYMFEENVSKGMSHALLLPKNTIITTSELFKSLISYQES